MAQADIIHARRDWTGDIASLVSEAARLQAELGLGDAASAPNLRLVRHYQYVGCVGKPDDRDGTRALFGYRQLLETVAVRVLLQDGWKLAKIGGTLASLDEDAIERLIMARGAGVAVASQSAPPTEAPVMAVEGASARSALALLAGFRQMSGLPPAVASPPANKSERRESSGQPQGPRPRTVAEYSPAPWLRIVVDEAALARAEPGTVARALAEAATILARLKT